MEDKMKNKIEHKEFKIDWQIKSFNEATQEGIIEGFAAFYNNIDSYGDKILYGAFKKTISENAFFQLFYNHLTWDTLPIGKTIMVEETKQGLRFQAKLSATTMGKDVYILIKDGVLNSTSIGYITIKENITDEGIRELKEIKLLEISVVFRPANDKAVITGVKSEDIEGFEKRFNEIESQIAELKSLLADEEPDVTTPAEPEADEELTDEEIDIIRTEIEEMQIRLEELAS